METIEEWFFGESYPNEDQFKVICKVLEVMPKILTMSSIDLVTRARHLRVARFYLNEFLGYNDAPVQREIREIESDIQNSADRGAAEEDVKSAEITIFSPPQTDSTGQSDSTASNE